MIINQEHFTTYKSLFPVLRTQATAKSIISPHSFGIRSFSLLAPSLVVPDKPKFKPVQKDQDW